MIVYNWNEFKAAITEKDNIYYEEAVVNILSRMHNIMLRKYQYKIYYKWILLIIFVSILIYFCTCIYTSYMNAVKNSVNMRMSIWDYFWKFNGKKDVYMGIYLIFIMIMLFIPYIVCPNIKEYYIDEDLYHYVLDVVLLNVYKSDVINNPQNYISSILFFLPSVYHILYYGYFKKNYYNKAKANYRNGNGYKVLFNEHRFNLYRYNTEGDKKSSHINAILSKMSVPVGNKKVNNDIKLISNKWIL